MARQDLALLDNDTREWINARSSWLLDQFGWERVRTCPVVLPTAEFFPGPFSETEEDARAMLDQMCKHLKIDPQSVELTLYYEGARADGGATTLGAYEQEFDRFRVWIEISQLHDSLGLAATMAHELGHVHLLGHGRLGEDADDHEPLTDLLTVFLGLGVISANAALKESNWRSGGLEGWRIGRCGYLTMPMYGYALALFSRIREESSSSWPKYLRPDVRDAFRKSLRYLGEHGVPELRAVRWTSARPAIVARETVDPAVALASPSGLETVIAVCGFCGADLSQSSDSEGNVCEECRISIGENQAELEAELRAAETASHRRQVLFKWTCLCLAVIATILALLEWLRDVP